MIVKTPGILDADRLAFSDGVSEVLCTMAHKLVAMKAVLCPPFLASVVLATLRTRISVCAFLNGGGMRGDVHLADVETASGSRDGFLISFPLTN